MKIHWFEISPEGKEFRFDQREPWLVRAIERLDETDETPEEKVRESLKSAAAASAAAAKNWTPSRDVDAEYTFRKVDDVVVVDGHIDSRVRLVCSRCANYFDLTVSPRFSALFCRDPSMAGIAHLEAGGKPTGQNAGFARHEHDSKADADVEAGKDLDITYLAGDLIDLADFTTEQIQLQLPFQPLCKKDCKGLCVNCGTDLNVGRCACSKLSASSPFASLAKLKLH
jgi:uncharacterized metal-binding protein YceD (DUF177 family)